MHYAQIRKYDVANGEGIRTTLFVSGCKFHCPYCFNKEYQNFNYGELFTYKTIQVILNYLSDENVKGLSILGGEIFMQNPLILLNLLTQVKETYPDKDVWVWTGYKLENIPKVYDILLPYIDMIIDGQFVNELKDIRLQWRGSSNQRIFRKNKLNKFIECTDLYT